MPKYQPGDVVAERTWTTIAETPVRVPDPDGLVHLQFRRFAGCPVCNLRLRSMARRHREVLDAGVWQVVVFHSSADDLRQYASDLPFDVIADPGKVLYAEFGVEAARRALLHPAAWPGIVRGVLYSLWGIVRHRRRMPPIVPPGGRYGLPADLLLAPDGTVLAAKYGVHADDQWSVDDVLALAATAGAGGARGRGAPAASIPHLPG